jgi:hypothetical protein
MSDFDFNNAEPATGNGRPDPRGHRRSWWSSTCEGGAGPGGCLKLARRRHRDAGLRVHHRRRQYDRRRLWENWITSGETDGQQKAAIDHPLARPRDLGERARPEPWRRQRRRDGEAPLNGWGALDALKICVKIGVETGGLKDKSAGPHSERYADKNKIKAILTPADSDYIAPGPQNGGFQQAGAVVSKVAAGAGAKAAAGGVKPAWAS